MQVVTLQVGGSGPFCGGIGPGNVNAASAAISLQLALLPAASPTGWCLAPPMSLCWKLSLWQRTVVPACCWTGGICTQYPVVLHPCTPHTILSAVLRTPSCLGWKRRCCGTYDVGSN